MTDDAGASRLVLLRHGQSTANAEGLFTGLLDVGLSQTGVAEAHRAAAQLSAAHIEPDTTYLNTESAHAAAELLAHEGGT